MRWLGPKGERPGWEKAPSIVETEIRTVWQEDELPDEITKAPGFHPFTLGLEAQEWVDSMAEVVDGGNGVYGRPKPVVPQQHRQLTTPSFPASPPPAAASPSTFPPADYRPPPPVDYHSPPPPKPRILMPDIDEASPPPPKPSTQMPDIDEPSPPSKPRVLMPDVDEAQAPPQPRPLMPDVDALSPSQPRVVMPDIDEAKVAPQPHVLMPEVDGSSPSRPRTLPRRVSMPEIGEEEQQSATQKPPSMPDIG